MSDGVFLVKDTEMTQSELNKLVIPASKPSKNPKRSPQGNPQPYRDGNRWKSVGYYLDETGAKKKVYGTGSTQKSSMASRDKLLAKRKLEVQLAKIPTGLDKVTDYCKHWFTEVKSKETQLAHKTSNGYAGVIKNWIIPGLGALKLKDVAKPHILALYESVKKAGKSRSTQNQIRAVLNQMFAEAVAQRHIDFNPVAGVRLMKSTKKYPSYFELDETNSILSTATSVNDRLKWELAVIYGLRQGERLGLTWENVHLDSSNPRIEIKQQLQRFTGAGLLLTGLKTPKSIRNIPLTEETVELFRSFKDAYNLAKLTEGDTWNSLNLVFVNSKGHPIDSTADRKNWVQLLKTANVDFQVGHTARHTAGTLIGDINLASKLLGHSSIQVTADFYSNARSEAQRAALSAMQDRVRNSA